MVQGPHSLHKEWKVNGKSLNSTFTFSFNDRRNTMLQSITHPRTYSLNFSTKFGLLQTFFFSIQRDMTPVATFCHRLAIPQVLQKRREWLNKGFSAFRSRLKLILNHLICCLFWWIICLSTCLYQNSSTGDQLEWTRPSGSQVKEELRNTCVTPGPSTNSRLNQTMLEFELDAVIKYKH